MATPDQTHDVSTQTDTFSLNIYNQSHYSSTYNYNQYCNVSPINCCISLQNLPQCWNV